MDRIHKIHDGFEVHITGSGRNYELIGLAHNGRLLVHTWKGVAIFLVVITDFCHGKLLKGIQYQVGNITMFRARKSNIEYLNMAFYDEDGNDQCIYIRQTEARIFPAIINRIIHKCDVMYCHELDKVEMLHMMEVGND